MKKKPKNLRQVNALTIIIFVCAIFWLMPLVLIFINSFKPYNDMLQDFLALPKSWSLKMYMETWTKFGFPSLIFNTLLYTFCTVILVVLMAPMAAYKLARTKSSMLCSDHHADDGSVPVLHDHPDKTGFQRESDWNKNRIYSGKCRLVYAAGCIHDPWICKKCAYRSGRVCMY